MRWLLVAVLLSTGCAGAQAPAAEPPAEALGPPRAAEVATGGLSPPRAAEVATDATLPLPQSPSLPAGARVALTLAASALGRPERLALFPRADGPVAAIARSGPATVQLVPLGGLLATLPPAPPKDASPGRLFAVAQGEGAVVALELAGEHPAVSLATPGGRERLSSLRPCALAAAGGASWIVGDRPGTAPGEPEGGPELVLFALGVRGVRADVPAGLSAAHPEGELCAAIPLGSGLLLGFGIRGGALQLLATDPAGRPLLAPTTVPLVAGDHAASPALAPLGDGALLVHASKLDGAIRAFRVGPRGAIEAGPWEVTPPHRDGPIGGLSLVALPSAGFALAFHQARVDLAGSPTELALVILGADGKATGPPVSLLAPLAHAPGPAALATDGAAIYVGAIVTTDGGKVAKVLRLPLPQP